MADIINNTYTLVCIIICVCVAIGLITLGYIIGLIKAATKFARFTQMVEKLKYNDLDSKNNI